MTSNSRFRKGKIQLGLQLAAHRIRNRGENLQRWREAKKLGLLGEMNASQSKESVDVKSVREERAYQEPSTSVVSQGDFTGQKIYAHIQAFENNEEEIIPDSKILQDSASSSMQESAYNHPISILYDDRPFVQIPNLSNNELQYRDVVTEEKVTETCPSFLQSESMMKVQKIHGNDDYRTRQKKRKRRQENNNGATNAVSDRYSILDMALSAISRKNDESQIFGDFVASSLRNLKSDANRRKLRLAIQKVILDISTFDGDN